MDATVNVEAREDAYSRPLDGIDVSVPELYQDDVYQPYFERLRREDPVHYCADSMFGPYWSVTRYKDIMKVAVNHQVFSSEGGITIANQNGEQGPLSDIHFDYNDYTVRQQDSEILHSNADWLQKNAGRRVQIEGHCDERGSEEYNIALGAKRAQAAKEYLQTLGVAGDRMSTISYGKELPLCTEHTEDCWAENRRDHFAVTE